MGAGTCSTRASRPGRTAACSGSGWPPPRTCSPGSASRWWWRPTRAGTRPAASTRAARRPGGTRGCSRTPPTAGSTWSSAPGSTTGPADGRGVLGHASSADLRTWEAGPPLSAPGRVQPAGGAPAGPGGRHLAGRLLRLVDRPQRRPPGPARRGRRGRHPLPGRPRPASAPTPWTGTPSCSATPRSASTPAGSCATATPGGCSPGATSTARAASSASSATRCP